MYNTFQKLFNALKLVQKLKSAEITNITLETNIKWPITFLILNTSFSSLKLGLSLVMQLEYKLTCE